MAAGSSHSHIHLRAATQAWAAEGELHEGTFLSATLDRAGCNHFTNPFPATALGAPCSQLHVGSPENRLRWPAPACRHGSQYLTTRGLAAPATILNV